MSRHLALLVCLAAFGCTWAGCGKSVGRWEKQITAEDSPDLRREGVLELMQSWRGKSDGAVRLYTLLGQTDEDPTVRSAAVGALGRSGNEKAVPGLTKILTEDVDPQVRTEAATALGKVRSFEAVGSLIEQLRQDQVNEVKAACARSLGGYPYGGVVGALVAAMLNDDFSIVYEAQQSLEKLTGESFQSSRAWQNWLQDKGDPFEATVVND